MALAQKKMENDVDQIMQETQKVGEALGTKTCIKSGVTALRNIIVKTKSMLRALGACRCLTVLKFQSCISRLQDSTTQRPISYSLK
jgi:hypothetical protein